MYNLPFYYLLPLIGLNFKNFGSYKSKSNLEAIKFNIKTLKLICRVSDITKVKEKAYDTKRYIRTSKNFIHYEFPDSLPQTIVAFREGKYSEIPESIKQHIINNCGLPKNHDVLLALKKDPKLKTRLEDFLETSLQDDAELLSVPEEDWFVE